MDILPDLRLPRVTQSARILTRNAINALDQVIVVLPKAPSAADFRHVPQANQIKALLAHAKEGDPVFTRFANPRGTGLTVARFDGATRFAQLSWARKLIAIARRDKPSSLGILAVGLDEPEELQALTALVLSALAASFEMPSFKSERKHARALTAIRLFAVGAQLPLAELCAWALGNNVARWFTALPPNQLTAKAYRNALRSLSKEFGLSFEFLDERKLSRFGAGAFLAVSQGNSDRDAGIVRLRHAPARGKKPELCLVGKGILFDTGGTNLKPFTSMLDMHTDMQGSAVALGSLIALATLEVPYGVEAWLSITENRISATAYKSQDLVRAANGTTIQVIHTDAEGRMVLADTLALAAREQPAMIIDYATLTGACIGALTERYSGVFSNRSAANALLRRAGEACGERVWPFPMDADFDDALRSDIADVKQCATSGSGDHILAARFLARFVPPSIPWVHLDLSAGQKKEGLAHIPTEITGFGVGVTLELLRENTPTALAKQLA
jgi:leucyl aminopeptidase